MGSFIGERGVLKNVYDQKEVLRTAQHSPRRNVRRLANQTRSARMQVWRTLHQEGLYIYIYHYRCVQTLDPHNDAVGNAGLGESTELQNMFCFVMRVNLHKVR